MDDLNIWLRLSLTSGIGAVSAKRLIGAFDKPGDIARASASRLREAGLTEAQADAFLADDLDAAVEQALSWAAQDNNHLIGFGSRDYPARLAQIHDAPPVLYVIGDKEVLQTPQLAIVGTRKPTPSAAHTAREFAASIAARGLTITSGLALGIDGEAHQGCLDA
ncbi:MAG: DNA-processing protein DprA, partial [Gammaproteobacteria bacterium]|nr:DNA-processing protein DprA [Gammaproteobacteria bacterium]